MGWEHTNIHVLVVEGRVHDAARQINNGAFREAWYMNVLEMCAYILYVWLIE